VCSHIDTMPALESTARLINEISSADDEDDSFSAFGGSLDEKGEDDSFSGSGWCGPTDFVFSFRPQFFDFL
jgi:hypothetical protein